MQIYVHYKNRNNLIFILWTFIILTIKSFIKITDCSFIVANI